VEVWGNSIELQMNLTRGQEWRGGSEVDEICTSSDPDFNGANRGQEFEHVGLQWWSHSKGQTKSILELRKSSRNYRSIYMESTCLVWSTGMKH
jgi:hypothetical protein